MGHHDDAIQHSNSQQGDKSDRGRYRQIFARQSQCEDAADQCEWDVQKDDPGLDNGSKTQSKNDKDHDHRRWNNQSQSRRRPLLVLELTSPLNLDVLREG